MSTTTYIIIMAVCLLLSAYFSATETAFSSANITRLKTRAEKGNSRAALACKLLERYDKLLSTILIGNNIVNIAMASLGTVLFVRSFGDMGATLSTVVVTVVVLIFGEISPKSIAKDCAEEWAMTAAPFLRCLIWLLMPLNALFSLWKKLLAKVFHLDADSQNVPGGAADAGERGAAGRQHRQGRGRPAEERHRAFPSRRHRTSSSTVWIWRRCPSPPPRRRWPTCSPRPSTPGC